MPRWSLALLVAVALPACKSSKSTSTPTPVETPNAAAATSAAPSPSPSPSASIAPAPKGTLACRDEGATEITVTAVPRGYALSGPAGIQAEARYCNVANEDTGSAYVFRERFRFSGKGLTVDMFVEASRGSPPELVSAWYQAGDQTREIDCRGARALDASWYASHGCLAPSGNVVSLKFDSIENFGNGPVVHMVDESGRKYTFHAWKDLVYDDNPYFELIMEEGAVLPQGHRIREEYAGRFLDVAYVTELGEIDESAEVQEYDKIVWIENP